MAMSCLQLVEKYVDVGIEASLKLLEYKLDDRHWSVIKPFLVFLRHIKNDQYTGISMDEKVVEALRKI